MAAGVTEKLWEVSDIVAVLEQWELANFKPEYQFVVRQYAIGKGHSVSVLWRGGEVDSIFGFESEYDALQWIREKSQAWLIQSGRGPSARRPLSWLESKAFAITKNRIDFGIDFSSCALHRRPL